MSRHKYFVFIFTFTFFVYTRKPTWHASSKATLNFRVHLRPPQRGSQASLMLLLLLRSVGIKAYRRCCRRRRRWKFHIYICVWKGLHKNLEAWKQFGVSKNTRTWRRWRWRWRWRREESVVLTPEWESARLKRADYHGLSHVNGNYSYETLSKQE